MRKKVKHCFSREMFNDLANQWHHSIAIERLCDRRFGADLGGWAPVQRSGGCAGRRRRRRAAAGAAGRGGETARRVIGRSTSWTPFTCLAAADIGELKMFMSISGTTCTRCKWIVLFLRLNFTLLVFYISWPSRPTAWLNLEMTWPRSTWVHQ